MNDDMNDDMNVPIPNPISMNAMFSIGRNKIFTTSSRAAANITLAPSMAATKPAVMHSAPLAQF